MQNNLTNVSIGHHEQHKPEFTNVVFGYRTNIEENVENVVAIGTKSTCR